MKASKFALCAVLSVFLFGWSAVHAEETPTRELDQPQLIRSDPEVPDIGEPNRVLENTRNVVRPTRANADDNANRASNLLERILRALNNLVRGGWVR